MLIGINYFNQRGTLRGCINDVKNMSSYLNTHFGYAREDSESSCAIDLDEIHFRVAGHVRCFDLLDDRGLFIGMIN